jgi:hypothetical protein
MPWWSIIYRSISPHWLKKIPQNMTGHWWWLMENCILHKAAKCTFSKFHSCTVTMMECQFWALFVHLSRQNLLIDISFGDHKNKKALWHEIVPDCWEFCLHMTRDKNLTEKLSVDDKVPCT